jgi:hypothetical protein
MSKIIDKCISTVNLETDMLNNLNKFNKLRSNLELIFLRR